MEHKISIDELENTPSKTLEFHFDEKIKELVNNNAKLIDVNLMTLSMDDDYFSTMTSFIENVKTSLS